MQQSKEVAFIPWNFRDKRSDSTCAVNPPHGNA